MWGAVIGDLAGSIYEFEQFKKVSSIKVNDIILENSFYSDDTILTIAILDALLHDKNYEFYLKKYAQEYQYYQPSYQPYFKSAFSPGFMKWANGNDIGTSTGNGAMMRISAIGYLCNSEEEIIKNVASATIPSHNSTEAIDSATLIAKIIYFARRGYTKEEIISKLNIKYSYIPFQKFNMTCSETINNCLYALFHTNSFEEAIQTVISYGGDTDTNACIVGSMAEALYGINHHLIEQAKQKIPVSFVKTLNQGYDLIQR